MTYSLWFIPYDTSPFTKTAKELISDTVPRQFLSEDKVNHFHPHITVTSDINKHLDGKSPQEWLDGLELPAFRPEHDEVLLELDTVEAEDPFFRKMNISVKENANLQKLAAICRQKGTGASEEKAQAWSTKEYRPHMSLLYADVPTQDVKNKVPLIEMKIGFALGDLFACCGGALCLGSKLVLVDTSKPIKEWDFLAKRDTPWAVWRATRNLI